MNHFTKRWNAHRNIWKNNKTKLNHEIKDQFALIIHYKKFHKDNIKLLDQFCHPRNYGPHDMVDFTIFAQILDSKGSFLDF